MSKRRLSKRQRERIEAIQERRRERAALKQQVSQSEADEHTVLGNEQLGRVITCFGSQIDVEGIEPPYQGQIVRCHVRANLASLVTGDLVIWQYGEPNGVVTAREERESELVRPDNYGKLRPVAANVDRIGVVFAPLPEAHSNLIDRYLVAAETQGIKPFLVLNKCDLLEEGDHQRTEELVSLYRQVGYDVLVVSAAKNQGVDELEHYLSHHTSVLVGQSGVGKSSLLNKLLPDANSAVGALSETTNKGTHTTTASRLYHLREGGMLIDSPGIREFALTHLPEHRVIDGYIDFHPYLGRCRFRDCNHETEPGCALLDAVKRGDIQQVRLDNFRQILLSLNDNR